MGRYGKMNLFPLENEHISITLGQEEPVFQTPFGPFGLMTCYDIRFVELSRILALKGASTLFVVANFNTDLTHWRTQLQLRAIENQVYVVACNRVGSGSNGKVYFGHSLINHPWGKIAGEDGGEEILTGSIDRCAVTRARQLTPIYQDRQLQCYGEILEDFW